LYAIVNKRSGHLAKVVLRRAWGETDYERALEQLQTLADELERSHPGAAGSAWPRRSPSPAWA